MKIQMKTKWIPTRSCGVVTYFNAQLNLFWWEQFTYVAAQFHGSTTNHSKILKSRFQRILAFHRVVGSNGPYGTLCSLSLNGLNALGCRPRAHPPPLSATLFIILLFIIVNGIKKPWWGLEPGDKVPGCQKRLEMNQEQGAATIEATLSAGVDQLMPSIHRH